MSVDGDQGPVLMRLHGAQRVVRKLDLVGGEEAQHAVRRTGAECDQLSNCGAAMDHAEPLEGACLFFEASRPLKRGAHNLAGSRALLGLARGCGCDHHEQVGTLRVREGRDLR